MPTDKPEDTIPNIIKARLPPDLFDQVSTTPFMTPNDLLTKVVPLEGLNQTQAARSLFQPPSLQSDQSPSAQFREQLRLMQAAFPTCAKKEAELIAWTKVQQGLPAHIQQLILFNAYQTPKEDLLNKVDEAWRLSKATDKVNGISQSDGTIQDIAQVVERLENLEAVLRDKGSQRPQQQQRSDDGEVCYYHRRFGRQARNCNRPCRFYNPSYSKQPVKASGAPSP